MNVHKLALAGGFAAVLTTVCASASLVAQAGRGAPPAPVPPANAKELIARAKVLAKTDLLEEWQSLCEPTAATIAVRTDRSPGVLEPVKVFDNL